MLLLIVLAVLAIVAFGVGLTIHWLFIAAAVLALIWVTDVLGKGQPRGLKEAVLVEVVERDSSPAQLLGGSARCPVWCRIRDASGDVEDLLLQR